jgi:hypothetical protein
MSDLVIPIADHPLITAVPFVVPTLLIVAGLVFMLVRDRLRDGGPGE